MGLAYPTVESIVLTNILIVANIRVMKGDRHKVLSYAKLDKVVADVKAERGGVYDKAANLLVGVAQAHAFGSANRRTAYQVASDFLTDNGAKMRAQYQKGVMMGVRERFYIQDEVREWLKGNGIREFRRW